MNTLTLSPRIAEQLDAFREPSPVESAGVMYCTASPDNKRLLAFEFDAYRPDEYLIRSPVQIAVSPVAFNDRIQRARALNMTMILVHTHPGTNHATFSFADDAGEREMMPVLFRRIPDMPHGSLVLGTTSCEARFYEESASHHSMRILSIGKQISRWDHVHSDAQERFDRSYRALTREGQVALQQTRVGVVGLGGTGSLVAQQLAYLGVENVIFIDPDSIETTNLNRVVGAKNRDLGVPKVTVAEREYADVSPSTEITALHASAIQEEHGRALLDRDLIFCCTDTHGTRAVLNWLSYQYLIPMIDLGVGINVDESRGVEAITGRVQLVGPGMPCLDCCGTLDSLLVRAELLSESERKADQYISDRIVHQPSVINFNGIVASLATTMFVAVTTGLPLTARHQVYYGLRGEVRSAEAASKAECPICGPASSILARGETLRAIWQAAS
jgi:molybdopterin/thiamine biosynthesis adenylyltransferase